MFTHTVHPGFLEVARPREWEQGQVAYETQPDVLPIDSNMRYLPLRKVACLLRWPKDVILSFHELPESYTWDTDVHLPNPSAREHLWHAALRSMYTTVFSVVVHPFMSLRLSHPVGDHLFNFRDTAVASRSGLCQDHVFPSCPDYVCAHTSPFDTVQMRSNTHSFPHVRATHAPILGPGSSMPFLVCPSQPVLGDFRSSVFTQHAATPKVCPCWTVSNMLKVCQPAWRIHHVCCSYTSPLVCTDPFDFVLFALFTFY